MTEDLIPADVCQFILQNIDSVAQLEALLLLRAERDKDWTAAQVCTRLYISEGGASSILVLLAGRGLLTSSDDPARYRYQPSSPEIAGLIDRIPDLYARYLVPITNFIHAKPKARVQEFADAFRIRKTR